MEYPFKDLLPLDEVLERKGYYKDWTHLDPEVFYSLTQISEYIKTKGYGVDVRLLIAQLAEHFGLKTTQVVDLANLLQQKFTNLEGVTQSFTNNINSLVAQMEAEKNAVIANATVDSEVILARGNKATLGERLDDTTAQLAQNTTYYLLSELGLGVDGIENLQKIMDKLTKNNVVFIVDGDYPIATDEPFKLENDLNLVSYNKGKLILENDHAGFYFDVRSNVNIKNVGFVNNTDGLKRFLGTTGEGHHSIDNISITGCSFEGYIRVLLIQSLPYINTVTFIGNTIKNVPGSFFQISGTGINTVNIKHNYVENWFYRAFSITSRSGEPPKEINFEHNHGTNTDDWVFAEENPYDSYYVFALLEGEVINYKHNTVENMKSIHSISLYDCYGGTDVNYENNVFKNNVCFDNTHTSVLMKPKEEGSIKKFINNRFIIEDQFITKFGYNPAGFKVKLYDIWGGYEGPDVTVELHTLPVEYDITDNVIEVPNLVLEASRRLVKKFVFNNNIINTRSIKGSLVATRYKDAVIKINDNTFNVTTDNERYSLVNNQIDKEAPLLLVEIHGNTFNKGFNLMSYATGQTIDIQNNTIADTGGVGSLFIEGSYDYVIAENNIYIGEKTKQLISDFTPKKQLISKNRGRIGSLTLRLDTVDYSIKDKQVTILVETFEGINKFSLAIENGILRFRDSAGTIRNIDFEGTSGNGVQIQNDGDDDSATLRLSNTVSSTRVILNIDEDVLPTVSATVL